MAPSTSQLPRAKRPRVEHEGPPLWWDLKQAIKNEGSLEEITRLLDNGAPTIAWNAPEGEHALTIAVTKGREDIVSLLVVKGADVNAVSGEYGTALAAAVFEGRKKIASLLLDRGADLNLVSGKYGTALVAAVLGQRKDMMSLFVNARAGISTVSRVFAGVRDMVSLLLDRGADINAVSAGYYGTALAAAATKGSTDIVSLLLDRGANINAVGGKCGTALAAAVYNGNTTTISLLLDQGAKINTVGGDYGTALATAVFIGSKKMVSLLLDRGADVDKVGGDYGTALAAAAFSGRSNMVSLLLERVEDIDAVGGIYGTALAAAAYRGSMETVSQLLGRRANINAVGGEYGTALAAAAFSGTMDIVSLLLDRGADINTVGGKYGTALAAAAFSGSTQIVSLLLDRGADTNTVCGDYGTALAASAFSGRQSTHIVPLLLDRGADVNTVGGEYGTALAAAAFSGSTEIASLLLDRGADINVVGGEYGTTLTAAAFGGSKRLWGGSILLNRGVDMNTVIKSRELVSLLLDRGANINAVIGKYGTALAAAAFNGSTDIMSLLLDRGANINAVGGEYGTAITAASFGGSKRLGSRSILLNRGVDMNPVIKIREVLSLLLDRGANINAVSGKYGTALAAAAFNGSTDIVSLLLDRGAGINSVGSEYGTALAAAAFGGSEYLGKSTDTLSRLLDQGTDNDQKTALTVATIKRSTDTVSLLLDRGAHINTVGGKYGTALASAAFSGSADIVLLLITRAADPNVVGGEYGTALAAAAMKGHKYIVSLLLTHRAGVIRVGGSYSTPFGVYPSALDAAHAEGWADRAMVRMLTTAISEQCGSTNQLTYPNNIILRPPFPMPYTLPFPALCVAHHKSTTLPPSFSDILSIQFRAGDSITPEQAGVLCSKLPTEFLCRSLPALVGLNKDTTQVQHSWIQNDVRYFVACNFDFGLAYAAARVGWKHFNESSVDSRVISIQRSQWHEHEQMLNDERSKAIEIDNSSSGQELIISPYSIMPRRLWDLKSNRVVDFQMLQTIQSPSPTFWAVSHSWTSNMSSILTAINQYQWPIPLPVGTSLDSLRSELLTLGAEYVWIDVVCLRQQSEVDGLEQLRQEEWKLDVPTIGNIYRAAAKIVRYFNGLGVSFSNSGWDNPRHWLQRAWTLQEIANENNTINGGIPRNQGHVVLNSRGRVSGKVIKLRDAIRPVLQLATQVDSPRGCEVYRLAQEMTRRHASKPVDKISGLFYLLRTTKLPCYDAQMTSEDFWRQCFYLLPTERKVEILFDFPYRGSDNQWFPTWAQVLDWPKRDLAYDHIRSPSSPDLIKDILGKRSLFISNAWTIPNVVLYGTDSPGEYQVSINGMLFGFYLPYLSQKPINVQDPSFTLVTAHLGHAHNWAVCKTGNWAATDTDLELGEFNVLKKVGVIRTDSCAELLVGGLLKKMDCLFV